MVTHRQFTRIVKRQLVLRNWQQKYVEYGRLSHVAGRRTINPFKPKDTSPVQMDRSISNFRVARWYFLFWF